MKIISFFLASLVLFLSQTSNIFADVGMSDYFSHGGIISTDQPQTNVSMDYEKVVVSYRLDGEKLIGHVSAVFIMNNDSLQKETINVFFPIWDFLGYSTNDHLEIKNFVVNGVRFNEDQKTDLSFFSERDNQQSTMPVYEWKEEFELNTEKKITIEYDVEAAKNYEFYYLSYVLGTGSSWKGSIKQGEVEFVLPMNIPDYAVVTYDKTPESTLSSRDYANRFYKGSYQVIDNKILVKFADYEPRKEEVIFFGISDLNIVQQIENLKLQKQSFTNTLKIANLFRDLSVGVKCRLCIEPSSSLSKEYFNKAIELASSKEELIEVLEVFVFGNFAYDSDGSVSSEVIDRMKRIQACAEDLECLNKYYTADPLEENSFDRTTIGSDYLGIENKNTIRNVEFLQNVSEKMRQYDAELADLIEYYILKAPSVIEKANEKRDREQKEYEGRVSSKESDQSIIASYPNKIEIIDKSKFYSRIGLLLGLVVLFFINKRWKLFSLLKEKLAVVRQFLNKKNKPDRVDLNSPGGEQEKSRAKNAESRVEASDGA